MAVNNTISHVILQNCLGLKIDVQLQHHEQHNIPAFQNRIPGVLDLPREFKIIIVEYYLEI